MEKKLKVTKHDDQKTLFEQEILSDSIITVGNNPGATLELQHENIAPEQFIIISENDEAVLMNRADGTVVNGKKLKLGSRLILQNGDRILIGDFLLKFENAKQNGFDESTEFESFEDQDNIEFDALKTDIEESISAPVESESEVEKSQDEQSEIEEENSLQIPKPDEKRNFSEILNTLKEEDTFYFQIKNEEDVTERIVFDAEEIWLGTRFAEIAVRKDKAELDEIYARVKKDWSGAVIYPQESEEVYLNGKMLEEPSRLKNDDQIILLDEFSDDTETEVSVTFHEPQALLVLNSILPEDLPEPITLQTNRDKINEDISSPADALNSADEILTSEKKTGAVKRKRGKVFGYFSGFELLIMAIGTLVTAAIIFLVLEYV